MISECLKLGIHIEKEGPSPLNEDGTEVATA
jgi:hypothetical protein